MGNGRTSTEVSLIEPFRLNFGELSDFDDFLSIFEGLPIKSSGVSLLGEFRINEIGSSSATSLLLSTTIG